MLATAGGKNQRGLTTDLAVRTGLVNKIVRNKYESPIDGA
jgi:hypothetical protein